MRVLHILNRFNIGGPIYYVAYLTKFMPDVFDTMLIGGVKEEEEGTSEYILEQYGIKPIVIKSMYRSISWLDIKAYKEIKKIIKEYQPDIVHTHAAKAGILGRLAAKVCGVKVIVHTFHGHVFDKYFGGLKSFIYKTIERIFALLSTKIIALSNLQAQELCEKYRICPKKKIVVIPLGLDLTKFFEETDRKRQQFRQWYNIADDEIAVAIIGRLAPIKNFKFFLEVINLVLQTTSKKVKFFVVGDGEEHKMIEQYAEHLGISYANYNHLAGGQCPDVSLILTSWIKEVDCVNAGVDIVTLTSLNEGTPTSLIESQAANKPIVANRVGGVADIVLEGKTALLAERDNLEDFVSKMLQLIEDDDLRSKMSQEGASFAKKRFDYSVLIASMSDLYLNLYQQKVSTRDKKANYQ